MPIPTSSVFDTLDWNARAASTTDTGDRSITDYQDPLEAYARTRGSTLFLNKHAYVVADATALTGQRQAESLISLTEFGGAAPSGVYTFEVDVVPTSDLPRAFSDVGHRAAIGFVNQAGRSICFLLSSEGIAVADSFTSPSVRVLAGTKKFVTPLDSGEYRSVTLRAIRNDLGRFVLCFGFTDEAYVDTGLAGWADESDLDIWSDIAALSTSSDLEDGVYVYASAKTGALLELETSVSGLPDQSTTFGITSLRVATTQVTPSSRPTAKVVAPEQALVGNVITYSASGSEFTDGDSLTFAWELLGKPEGSRAQLSGGSQATATIGTVGADNAILFSYLEPVGSANGFVVDIVLGPPSSLPYVVADFPRNYVKLVMGADAFGAQTTTAQDLVEGLNRSTSSLFSDELLDVLSVEYADLAVTGSGLVPTGRYVLSGGVGSSLERPVLVVDVEGVYLVQLVVNDGLRSSRPVFHTTLATFSEQLLGHRPKSEYIYRYISDFWSLIADRDLLPVLWSAVTQVVGAEVVSLWQNDYSKSIRDIGSSYQRRWLQHKLLVPPTEPSLRAPVVVPSKNRLFTVNTGFSVSGTHAVSGTLAGGLTSSDVSSGYCLVFDPVDGCSVERIVGVRDLTGSSIVTMGRSSLRVVEALNTSTAGRFVYSPYVPVTQPQTTDWLSDPTYRVFEFDVTDEYVRYTLPSGDTRQVSVASVFPDGEEGVLQLSLSTNELVSGVPITWEHVRRVDGVQLLTTPYLDIKSVFPDGVSSEFETGDTLSLEVSTPYSDDLVSINLSVFASDDERVFVDWAPLLSTLTMLDAMQYADSQARKIWSEEDLGLLSYYVVGLYRHRSTTSLADLVSVPRVGPRTDEFSMLENLDFAVANERLELVPLLSGTFSCAEDSDLVRFDRAAYHPSFSFETSLAEFQRAGGYALVLGGANAGTYQVLAIDDEGGSITLDRRLRASARCHGYMPQYSPYGSLDDGLWAEVSYFDNHEAIEGNFGLYVGLPFKDFSPDSEVDYLSAVKALWFAFWSGPTPYNIQLAAQALLGLPYAEHGGQVIEIVEPTSETLGRVVLRAPDGGIKTYNYPLGVEFAVNRATGRQIRSFPDLREEISVLTEDELARYQDSLLPQYSTLFDVVQIFDYVSNPDGAAALLRGQDILRQYHTFFVTAPLSVLSNPFNFDLLAELIEQVKPAHTDFELIGGLGGLFGGGTEELVDEISIEDDLLFDLRLILGDTLSSSPYSGSTTAYIWPRFETLSKSPGSWTDADVQEKYESGYMEGVLDDFGSGDGGWNSDKGVIDPVNTFVASDVDVPRSFLLVPVDIQSGIFEHGEYIDVKIGGSIPAEGSFWENSPPVVVCTSAGEHPKIPFGVEHPQYLHPVGWLLLGFYDENMTEVHGDERRLDVLEAVDAAHGPTTIQLVGRTNGGIANVTTVPVRGSSPTGYFQLRYMFDTDKLIDFTLGDRLSMYLGQYVDFGGLTIANAITNNPMLDSTAYPRTASEFQTRPYDSTLTDDDQFVPSFGPGFFTGWSDKVPANPLVWGYQDVGDLGSTPTPLASFASAGGTTTLENVTVGFRKQAIPAYHLTHGFLGDYRAIPEPQAVLASWNSGTLRVEGMWMIGDDPTRTLIPSNTAASHDGTIGGSWVFLRDGVGTEYAATGIVFETGTAGGRTVLGLDGAVQTSTGHVIEGSFVGVPTGATYDVIVREYRPYKNLAAGATLRAMFEYVLEEGVTIP